MPKDLFNILNPVVALAPTAAVKTNQTGSTVSMSGYQGVDFAVAIAATGDTLSTSIYYELYLVDSPDGTTWSDVAAQFVQNGANNTALAAHSGVIAVVSSSNASAQVIEGGYLGIQPYVRLMVAVTGTMTNGTNMAAVAIQGHGKHNPAYLGLQP